MRFRRRAPAAFTPAELNWCRAARRWPQAQRLPDLLAESPRASRRAPPGDRDGEAVVSLLCLRPDRSAVAWRTLEPGGREFDHGRRCAWACRRFVIEELRGREIGGLVELPPGLKVGDPVRVERGPLKGAPRACGRASTARARADDMLFSRLLTHRPRLFWHAARYRIRAGTMGDAPGSIRGQPLAHSRFEQFSIIRCHGREPSAALLRGDGERQRRGCSCRCRPFAWRAWHNHHH
jgi:hypothetical protein